MENQDLNQEIFFVERGATIADTTFGYTLSVIGGKWKLMILFWIYTNPPAIRFNELKRLLGAISFKTLSSALKELEKDGLVHREEFPQIPPKVEYSLTAKGEKLLPILQMMCEWGKACLEEQGYDVKGLIVQSPE